MNRSQLVVNIGVLVLSVLFFLLLLEIFLRVTDTPSIVPVPCVYADARIAPYRIAKNVDDHFEHPEFTVTYKTNADGFRGDELENTPEYRIVGFGDSMTFGMGVENNQTYLSVLERELGGSIEVVNAGVGAFNSVDAFNYMREVSQEIDFNMTIFAIFLGNDIHDNLLENNLSVDSSGCLFSDVDSEEARDNVREFLYKNFYVVRFFSSARKIWIINYLATSVVGIGSHGEDNPHFSILKKEKSDQFIRAIEKTQSILLDVKQFTEKNNKTLLVVILPYKYHVYDELFLSDVEKYLVDRNDYNNLELNEILGSFLEINEIDYVDVTYSLRDYLKEHPDSVFYYEKDGHFVQLGNEIVGMALAQKIGRP